MTKQKKIESWADFSSFLAVVVVAKFDWLEVEYAAALSFIFLQSGKAGAKWLREHAEERRKQEEIAEAEAEKERQAEAHKEHVESSLEKLHQTVVALSRAVGRAKGHVSTKEVEGLELAVDFLRSLEDLAVANPTDEALLEASKGARDVNKLFKTFQLSLIKSAITPFPESEAPKSFGGTLLGPSVVHVQTLQASADESIDESADESSYEGSA